MNRFVDLSGIIHKFGIYKFSSLDESLIKTNHNFFWFAPISIPDLLSYWNKHIRTLQEKLPCSWSHCSILLMHNWIVTISIKQVTVCTGVSGDTLLFENMFWMTAFVLAKSSLKPVRIDHKWHLSSRLSRSQSMSFPWC